MNIAFKLCVDLRRFVLALVAYGQEADSKKQQTTNGPRERQAWG